MTDNERKAIVNLLDDPDESVYCHIREKILQSGCTILPDLEVAGATHHDPLVLKRAEELARHILFNQTAEEWKVWVRSPEKDLLTAAVLLAKHHYPDIRVEDEIIKPVEKISRDVWLEIRDDMTHFEKILVLNKVLFAIYGFSVHPGTDRAPHLIFLNDLLTSGKGNACTLAWLYMIIAHRNDIPVMGVDLRGRFVLCITDNNCHDVGFNKDNDNPVLFFINSSNGGAIYNSETVDLLFLGKKKISSGSISRHHSALYLKPCGNKTAMANFLRHYAFAFRKTRQTEKMDEVYSLIHIITQSGKHTTGGE